MSQYQGNVFTFDSSVESFQFQEKGGRVELEIIDSAGVTRSYSLAVHGGEGNNQKLLNFCTNVQREFNKKESNALLQITHDRDRSTDIWFEFFGNNPQSIVRTLGYLKE